MPLFLSNSIRPHRRLVLVVSLILAATLVSPLNAQLLWDPDGASPVGGGSGTWDTTGTDWSTLPTGGIYSAWNNANNDAATFGGTAGTVTLGSNVTANSLTFGVNGYTIEPDNGDTYALTLAGSGANIDTATFDATISAVIAGTVGFSKLGTGELTLSAANTYTGGTSISAGTLTLGDGGTTGSIVGNVVNNGSLAFNRSDALTFSGDISGSGSVKQSGSGMTTLSGTNTYTGVTTLSSGTLALGSAGALGSTGNIQLNGGRLQFSAANTTDYSNRFTGSKYRFDTNGQDVTFANALNHSNGKLIKYGAGTLTLEGDNTYGPSDYQNVSTRVKQGTLVVASGGSIDHTYSSIAIGNQSGDNATFTIESGATVDSYDVNIGGNGGIGTANVAGTWSQAPANFIKMLVNNQGTLNVLEGGKVNYSDVWLNNGGNINVAGTLNNGGTMLVYGGAGKLTIADTGQVNSGPVRIGGSNKTGTVITDGFLNAGTSSMWVGYANNGFLTINAGGRVKNGTGSLGGPFFSSAKGTATVAGTWNNTGALSVGSVADGTLNILAGGLVTNTTGILGTNSGTNVANVAGTWTNSGNLTIGNSGVGTLNLNDGGVVNVNSGTGSVTLAAGSGSGQTNLGTLNINGDANPGILNASTIKRGNDGNTSGVINFNHTHSDYHFTTNGATDGTPVRIHGGEVNHTGTGNTTLAADNTSTGKITLSAGTLQIGNGGTSGSIAGNVTNNSSLIFNRSDASTYTKVISGSGDVTKLGAGTLTFTGDHTYSGGTTISAGSLQLGNGGTTGAITGNVLNNANLTLNRSNALSLTGDISGTGSITQAGSGTTTLSGANTYSGGTTISAGSLAVESTGSIDHSAANFYVGRYDGDDGALQIASGGSVSSNNGYLSSDISGTSGTANISGTWTNAGTLRVGDRGTGTLTIQAGGLVSNTTGFIAHTHGSTGTANVSGTWTNSGDLWAGRRGNGTLNIEDGGVVNVNSGSGVVHLTDTTADSRTGTINLNGSTNPGILNAASVDGGPGTAILNFNHTNADYHFTTDGTSSGTAIAITGSTAVNHTDTGTTTLAAANTYSGGTTLSGGTLALGSAGAIGSTGTISFTGGTLQSSAANTTDYSSRFSNADNQTYALDTNGQNVTLASALSSTGGSLTKSGAGTLSLTADNTYTGGTTLSAGSLQLGNGGTTGAITGNVLNNANLTLNRSNALALSGDISGSGSLTQAGSGTTTLTGTNTFTGGTTISGGTLQIGNGGTSGSLFGSIVNNANLTLNRSDALALSGGITGSGSLTQAGSGTTTVTGDYTFAGGTTISGGTLQIGNGGTSGSITGAITNDANLSFNRSDSLNFSEVISGSGSLTQTSSGTTTLSNSNTYSGGTTLSGGTLALGHATDTLYNSGAVTVAGGSLDLGANSDTVGAVSLTSGSIIGSTGVLTGSSYAVESGSISANLAGAGTLTKTTPGTVSLSGTNTYTGGTMISGGTLQIGEGGTSGSVTGDITNNATLSFNRSDSLNFSEVISGTGSLTQAGSGTTTLSNSNTYSGGTTLSGGTLSLGSAGAIGSTGTISFTGGTLQSSAANTTDYSSRFSNADNQTYALDTNGQNITLASALSSTGGSLTKSGAGTLSLTADNTYTGGTTLSGGTLALGSAGAIGSTGTISFSGGTLQSSAANTTDHSSRFSNADNQTYTLDTNGQNVTLASALSSTGGSLTKLGAGTLSLSAANTYTGTTTLSSGTLQLGHSLALQNSTLSQSENATLSLGSLTAVTLGGLNSTKTISLTNDSSAAIALTIGNNNSNTTYSNIFSGSGSLTKTGTGKLTLTNDHTYAGGTTISAGSLQLGDGGTTGSVVGNITNNGSLIHSRSDDVTLSTVISGSGTLTKQGADKLTFTADQTYTGLTTVSAGTLQIGDGGTDGSIAGNLKMQAGTHVIFNHSDDHTYTGDIKVFNNPDDASLTKLGTGTLTLSGDLDHQGETTISQGRLVLAAGSIHDVDIADYYIGRYDGDDATLTINAGNNTGVVSRQGHASIGTHANSSGALEVEQYFWVNDMEVGAAGTGSLTISGNGDVETGDDSFVGKSSGSVGTVTISGNGNWGADNITVGSASGSQGSVTVSENGELDSSQTVTVGDFGTGTLTVNAGGLVAARVVSVGDSGTGTLTINSGARVESSTGRVGDSAGGMGTATVNGAWDINGKLWIGKSGTGQVDVGNGSSISTYQTGRRTITPATISLGDLSGGVGTLNINGSTNPGIVDTAIVTGGAGTASLNFNHTNSNHHFTNDGSSSGTAIAIEGTTTINHTGTGTTTLNGTNTYTGVTNISAGTLRFAQQTSLYHNTPASWTNANLTVAAGATLAVNVGGTGEFTATNLNTLKNLGNGTGGFQAGSFLGIDTTNASGNFTYNANITDTNSDTDALGLVKLGSGTLTLGGTNTYSGDTRVEAGTLKLGAADALSPNTHLRVQPGAHFNPNGFATTLGRLEGDGNVNLGSGNLSLNQADNTTFAGVIAGTGGLAKSGAGRLTLSGIHTFTGDTDVTAGELKLNGSAANSRFRINGGRLSGSGTIGQLTLGNGGTLAPGNSPGTLNAGSTTWEGGAAFEWEVNDASGIVSTNWDLLNITGGLNITANNANPFSINLVSLNVSDEAGDVINFDSGSDYVYSIAATTSGISGFSADAFTLNTSGFSNSFSGLWSLAVDGDNLNLVYTASAVPEPGSFALFAGLFTLGFVGSRRARRAK